MTWRDLGGRLAGSLLVVVVVVASMLLGAVGAVALAGVDLGAAADPEALEAWAAARPFVANTLGWLVALPALALVARSVLGLDFGVMGLRPHARRRPRFTLGLMGGLALILIPAGAARLAGLYVPASPEAVAALAVPSGSLAVAAVVYMLPALILAALGEEVLFRSVLLRLWEPVAGVRGALLLSALFFVAVHIANPGASLRGGIGVLLAGILLGALFVLHGDLWLVAGLHLGWNAAEALVLGVPVSGISLPSLLRWTVADDPIARGLLGEGFGPEEGLLFHAVLAMAIAIAVATRPGVEDPGHPSVSSVDADPARS